MLRSIPKKLFDNNQPALNNNSSSSSSSSSPSLNLNQNNPDYLSSSPISFKRIGRIKAKPKGFKRIGNQYIAILCPHEIFPDKYPAGKVVEIGNFEKVVDAVLAHDLALLVFMQYTNENFRDDCFNFPDLIIGATVPVYFENLARKYINELNGFGYFEASQAANTPFGDVDAVLFADGTVTFVVLNQQGSSLILNAELARQLDQYIENSFIINKEILINNAQHAEKQDSYDLLITAGTTVHLEWDLEKANDELEDLRLKYEQSCAQHSSKIKSLEDCINEKAGKEFMLQENVTKLEAELVQKTNVVEYLTSENYEHHKSQQEIIAQLTANLKKLQDQDAHHQEKIKELEQALRQKEQMIQQTLIYQKQIVANHKIESEKNYFSMKKKDELITSLNNQCSRLRADQARINEVQQTAVNNQDPYLGTQHPYLGIQESNLGTQEPSYSEEVGNKRLRQFHDKSAHQAPLTYYQLEPQQLLFSPQLPALPQQAQTQPPIYMQINNINKVNLPKF